MKRKLSQRGFVQSEMRDVNDRRISLRESSYSDEPCVWLGADSKEITIFEDETMGKYIVKTLPKTVMLDTDMHINQEMAKELAEQLMYFYIHGELPRD